MKRKTCVHTEHCSVHWGCKYADRTCPVWLGFKRQTYVHEYDYENGVRKFSELAPISIAEFKRRRYDALLENDNES